MFLKIRVSSNVFVNNLVRALLLFSSNKYKYKQSCENIFQSNFPKQFLEIAHFKKKEWYKKIKVWLLIKTEFIIKLGLTFISNSIQKMGSDICVGKKKQVPPYNQPLPQMKPPKNVDEVAKKFMSPNIYRIVSGRENIFDGTVATFHGEYLDQWVPIDDKHMYKGQWSAEKKKHGQGVIYNLKQHTLLAGCFSENTLIQLKCRKIYSNGYQYLGQLNEKYEKNGNGILTNEQKTFKYEGKFKNDLYDGEGKFEEKDTVFQGTFQKGLKKHGKQKNAKGTYEGPFENNKKEGVGKFYWDQGGRYEGDFHLDKIHGKGKLYDKENSFCGIHTFLEGAIVTFTNISTLR